MLCIYCGAINSKDDKICVKCGKNIYALSNTPFKDEQINKTPEIQQQHGKVSDIKFIPVIKASFSINKFGRYSRSLILFSLATMFFVMIPLFFYSNSSKNKSLFYKSETGESVNPPNFDNKAMGNENTSNNPAVNSGVAGNSGQAPSSPSSGNALVTALDTAKKARAMQIKSALHVYYAENDSFPDSLDQLYPGLIEKKPEDWLTYTTTGNPPYTFTLEFQLSNNDDNSENVNTDGDVKKYRLTSEY